MSDLVTDLSPAETAIAIDANQIEMYASFGGGPEAELHRDSDMTWFKTGIPHPILNGVLSACFTEETMEQRIESTLNHFKSNKLPMMWWTGPESGPSGLEGRLLAHGMFHGGHQPGMALDLDRLDPDQTLPDGLIIERVSNEKALREWMEPVRVGFKLPDLVSTYIFEHFMRLNPREDFPWRHYAGKINGRTVASATLFMGAGVAGLYHMATRPLSRRRGVASAMAMTALLDAREASYRLGVLQSSDAGKGVYEGLGFQTYCTLGRYIL